MNRRRMLAATATLVTPLITGCVGRSVDEVEWDTEHPGDGGAKGNPSESGDMGGEQTIEINDGTFSPGKVKINVQGTVTWKNTTDAVHRIKSVAYTGNAEQWSYNKEIPDGESASFTFDSQGVYQYYDLDAGQYAMCGMILVGEATSDFESPCLGTS